MDADSSEWVALWPYGLLIIVLGAWAVHLFLAPSNWPEWVGAGLLQTFIVAQMYGFPLTRYFLTSIVPIDTPLIHSSGHVWHSVRAIPGSGADVRSRLVNVRTPCSDRFPEPLQHQK